MIPHVIEMQIAMRDTLIIKNLKRIHFILIFLLCFALGVIPNFFNILQANVCEVLR